MPQNSKEKDHNPDHNPDHDPDYNPNGDLSDNDNTEFFNNKENLRQLAREAPKLRDWWNSGNNESESDDETQDNKDDDDDEGEETGGGESKDHEREEIEGEETEGEETEGEDDDKEAGDEGGDEGGDDDEEAGDEGGMKEGIKEGMKGGATEGSTSNPPSDDKTKALRDLQTGLIVVRNFLDKLAKANRRLIVLSAAENGGQRGSRRQTLGLSEVEYKYGFPPSKQFHIDSLLTALAYRLSNQIPKPTALAHRTATRPPVVDVVFSIMLPSRRDAGNQTARGRIQDTCVTTRRRQPDCFIFCSQQRSLTVRMLCSQQRSLAAPSSTQTSTASLKPALEQSHVDSASSSARSPTPQRFTYHRYSLRYKVLHLNQYGLAQTRSTSRLSVNSRPKIIHLVNGAVNITAALNRSTSRTILKQVFQCQVQYFESSNMIVTKILLGPVKDHGAPRDHGVSITVNGGSADKHSLSNPAHKPSIGNARSPDKFYRHSHRPTAPTSPAAPAVSPAGDVAHTGSAQKPSLASAKRRPDIDPNCNAQIGVRFCLDTLQSQWPREFELEMACRAKKSDPDLDLFSAINILDAKDEGELRIRDLIDKFKANKPQLDRVRMIFMSRYNDDDDNDDNDVNEGSDGGEGL
ncbi:hypothetical protein B0T21DRAFT_343084 [Apiosordaria backusii]|uniref:Uncharacterized protein n=1 Tax=Apiosordaria backusii TaxID=314023 RepID=A0AA40EXD2_9PEZI|nr:hypothetical protein B0T21DRAFT_343084 [Apiosordaria backusii]